MLSVRNMRWFAAGILGIIAAAGINKATRIKQVKAGKAGKHVPYGPYEAFFKRPIDAIFSAIALIFLSPVILILAFLVRIKLGKPVIFKQERPGKNEKIFTLYKFRTMTDEKDESGNLLPDEKRLTKFGSLLRMSSGDELPELINIIKGDMAIVGPRPLLVRYLPRYNERQRHRHDVRPGLTGLSQVSGRNEISWAKKIETDVQYVNNITFWGDLKIILQTIAVVLKHDGISIERPEFTGTEADE